MQSKKVNMFLSAVICTLVLCGIFVQDVCSASNYMYPRTATFLQQRQFEGNFQHLNNFDLIEVKVPYFQGNETGYDWVDSLQALKSRNDSLVLLAEVDTRVACSNWASYYYADDAWNDSMAAHDSDWWLRVYPARSSGTVSS